MKGMKADFNMSTYIHIHSFIVYSSTNIEKP